LRREETSAPRHDRLAGWRRRELRLPQARLTIDAEDDLSSTHYVGAQSNSLAKENVMFRLIGHSLLASVMFIGVGHAQEYEFAPAPSLNSNYMYSVNRKTGEVAACAYQAQKGTVGVTHCVAVGEGAGKQAPGDYHIAASHMTTENGIFRVNAQTGQMSICFVLNETLVCTNWAR
jgi:hypothetical protein